MRPFLPEHSSLGGGQWMSDVKNESHHKTPTRGTWSGKGAAAAGGCAAARRSFQPPGENKEQGTSTGGAGPWFGPEHSYYNMI